MHRGIRDLAWKEFFKLLLEPVPQDSPPSLLQEQEARSDVYSFPCLCVCVCVWGVSSCLGLGASGVVSFGK